MSAIYQPIPTPGTPELPLVLAFDPARINVPWNANPSIPRHWDELMRSALSTMPRTVPSRWMFDHRDIRCMGVAHGIGCNELRITVLIDPTTEGLTVRYPSWWSHYCILGKHRKNAPPIARGGAASGTLQYDTLHFCEGGELVLSRATRRKWVRR